jgi:hypothetical protein
LFTLCTDLFPQPVGFVQPSQADSFALSPSYNSQGLPVILPNQSVSVFFTLLPDSLLREDNPQSVCHTVCSVLHQSLFLRLESKLVFSFHILFVSKKEIS